uniref:Uncharacterized protein n=1 Tax=Anguilla anguilla TaxID=7936 RepID=A0A0E9WGP6_ANGAN
MKYRQYLACCQFRYSVRAVSQVSEICWLSSLEVASMLVDYASSIACRVPASKNFNQPI